MNMWKRIEHEERQMHRAFRVAGCIFGLFILAGFGSCGVFIQHEASGAGQETRLRGAAAYGPGDVVCPIGRDVCTLHTVDGKYLQLRCNDWVPGCTVENARTLDIQ